MAYDGAIFDLHWKSIKVDRPKVFAICDVSGSVANYARFMLMFLYSLEEVMPKVRSFAFSSDLAEVTDLFERNKIEFLSSHPEIFVNLDRTQWVRVMTNLIQNGIQSVPIEANAKLKVEIKKLIREVQIIFIDNGVGIPESIKDKIFEPKFTTKTKGMGLGLGIVKNIIDSHGGKINYSSSSKGTKFIITLKI